MFTELSLVAKTLPTAEPLALARALELSSTLCDVLLQHIAIEAAILVPTLRDIDAWGAGRADHLIDRLGIRRQEIAIFRESCAGIEGAVLGGAIDRFIEHRQAAMGRAAVRDLSILRDDVVGIDCNGG